MLNMHADNKRSIAAPRSPLIARIGMGLLLFLFLFLLPGITVGAATFRLVVLGSSTAAGMGTTSLDSTWVNRYKSYLQQTLASSEVINLAQGGFTTFNVMPTGYTPPSPWNTSNFQPSLTRNITYALSLNPSLIIVNLPTNDCDLHVPVALQTANYDRLVQEASARSVPIWIASTQPRTNADALGRELLKAMRDTILIRYSPFSIDFWTGIAQSNGSIIPAYDFDGTHLNDAGNAVLFGQARATVQLPAPWTPSAGAPVSDDFSAGALNALRWTYFNPRNDATLALAGTGTQNARLSLSVPAGLTHDCWTGGMTAPRVMQAIGNSDFEVMVKFESVFSAGYQIQGLLVQQDPANFIRFDVVRDSDRIKFFSATFTNDVPAVNVDAQITEGSPLYMRVRRVGSSWTGSYSYDGTTWTQATAFSHILTTTSIGLWAGNAGSPSPAFTALTDFFFNTASPVVPEDPVAPLVAPSVAREPADQSVDIGQPAVFSVAASGTAPMSYQWQKNGTDIPGATDSSYTTPAIAEGDDGSLYRCIIANAVSSDTSTSATLWVIFPPSSARKLVSDEFTGETLNSSVWTFVNPTPPGRGVQLMTGSAFSLSVPRGSLHDIWTNGYRVPRLMQFAADTDFVVEAKFSSGVTAATADSFKIQGIVVEQDVQNVMRFDFTTRPGATVLFVATFAGGFASPVTRINLNIGAGGMVPLWLKVKRQSNIWSVFYSSNGRIWTAAGSFSHTLTVRKVGLFAGNSGTIAPAHTMLADYFRVNGLAADLKVYLQGAWISVADTMRTGLASALPRKHPYGGAPWLFAGADSITAPDIPIDVVDWVLVELRAGTSAASHVATRAALLKKNGSIVDLDGRSQVWFPAIPTQSYFAVIRHRNHLGAMSAGPLAPVNTIATYDFTADLSRYYGATAALLSTGMYGLIAGDTDASGDVGASDRTATWNGRNQTGYVPADVDLTGDVGASDRTLTWNNRNMHSNVP